MTNFDYLPDVKGYNCNKPIPILVDYFYVPVLISETRTKSSDYLTCISLTMSFLLKENDKSKSSPEMITRRTKKVLTRQTRSVFRVTLSHTGLNETHGRWLGEVNVPHRRGKSVRITLVY